MITSAGCYDIEIERYHHDPNLCDGPSISASGLKEIADCPAKYWAYSPYNTNRFVDTSTKALDVGKAAHALVLGEPEFLRYFIVSPYDDFRKKEAQQWRDEQTKTILKAADFDTVRAMAAAQRASPAVMQAFEKGEPEKSLIYRDEETGIFVRSRPDWLPHNPRERFVVDYKTALTIEPRQLSAAAFKYGYHLQAAMQLDAVAKIFDCKPLGIAHVVQEKDPPYLCDLRLFAPEHIELGRRIYRNALRTFADCLSSGIWPAYYTDPQFFLTPKWIERQIEDGSDSIYEPSDYLAA